MPKKPTTNAGAKAQKRHKPDEKKESILRVRLDREQRKILEGAAKRAGADVSTWLRLIGLERARDLLGEERIKELLKELENEKA